MRVLSPRMEPPFRVEEGSTACRGGQTPRPVTHEECASQLAWSPPTSTASLWPCEMTYSPNASIKVDFPAPGEPEIPMRKVLRSRSSCQGSNHPVNMASVLPWLMHVVEHRPYQHAPT